MGKPLQSIVLLLLLSVPNSDAQEKMQKDSGCSFEEFDEELASGRQQVLDHFEDMENCILALKAEKDKESECASEANEKANKATLERVAATLYEEAAVTVTGLLEVQAKDMQAELANKVKYLRDCMEENNKLKKEIARLNHQLHAKAAANSLLQDDNTRLKAEHMAHQAHQQNSETAVGILQQEKRCLTARLERAHEQENSAKISEEAAMAIAGKKGAEAKEWQAKFANMEKCSMEKEDKIKELKHAILCLQDELEGKSVANSSLSRKNTQLSNELEVSHTRELKSQECMSALKHDNDCLAADLASVRAEHADALSLAESYKRRADDFEARLLEMTRSEEDLFNEVVLGQCSALNDKAEYEGKRLMLHDQTREKLSECAGRDTFTNVYEPATWTVCPPMEVRTHLRSSSMNKP